MRIPLTNPLYQNRNDDDQIAVWTSHAHIIEPIRWVFDAEVAHTPNGLTIQKNGQMLWPTFLVAYCEPTHTVLRLQVCEKEFCVLRGDRADVI